MSGEALTVLARSLSGLMPRASSAGLSRLFFRPGHGSQRPDWLAGHIGLELPNPRTTIYLKYGDRLLWVSAEIAREGRGASR
jgi:hypothetical protein